MKAKLTKGSNKTPRRREFLFCPSCGIDLDKLRPRHIGDLYADPNGDTIWKGHEVVLTASERIILHTLLTAADTQSRRSIDRGHFVHPLVLAERADTTVETAKIFLFHVRRAFRQVDPDFNMIENKPSEGYRWRVGRRVPQVVARSRSKQRYVLYDDGALVVNNAVRVFFDPVKATRILEMLRVLIEANGEYVPTKRLQEIDPPVLESAIHDSSRRIRDRLTGAGLDRKMLQGRQWHGYRLVI